MNVLMKTVFRRFAGKNHTNFLYTDFHSIYDFIYSSSFVFQCLGQARCSAKHYHVESGITKFRCNVKPGLYEDLNISNLVQKTIIPLNNVNYKPCIIDKPRFNIVEKIDATLPEKIDITPSKEIEDPTSVNIIEKKAHRMLRIRRKKMKKHKPHA